MSRVLHALPCQLCAGEGTRYTSRYGGNDPDVWPTGTCRACEGTGNQSCEDCGDALATHEYQDPRHPQNKFLVCKECFDEWTEEDNAP